VRNDFRFVPVPMWRRSAEKRAGRIPAIEREVWYDWSYLFVASYFGPEC
jgi:hypothetical protein